MQSLVCLLVSLCCFQFYSPTNAQQCLLATNGDRQLPAFIKPGGGGVERFNINPIQAIITSYQFNCCGKITEWRAIVEGSGGGHVKEEPYTISFQVWRPNSTSSSYTMIGINHFSPIPLASSFTADRGIVTGVPPESERIEVQPGDVVGFYLESSYSDADGIQFAADSDYNEETVWFVTDTASIISPVPAMLSVGPTGLLSISTTLAPLISVSITAIGCPSSTQFVTTPTSLNLQRTLNPLIVTTPTSLNPQQTPNPALIMSSLITNTPITSILATTVSPSPTPAAPTPVPGADESSAGLLYLWSLLPVILIIALLCLTLCITCWVLKHKTTYSVSRANINEVKMDPVTNENEAYGKFKAAASPTDDNYDYIATHLIRTENPAYDRTVGGGAHYHENKGNEVTMGTNEAYIATRKKAASEEGEDNYDYVATGLEYSYVA